MSKTLIQEALDALLQANTAPSCAVPITLEGMLKATEDVRRIKQKFDNDMCDAFRYAYSSGMRSSEPVQNVIGTAELVTEPRQLRKVDGAKPATFKRVPPGRKQ